MFTQATKAFFAFALLFTPFLWSEPTQAVTKIKIGWQIPWATQGQLVQILKHTDILKKHGLEAEFIGRTYGPMLNELALAGAIDVVLTGDQPGLVLISKDKGWKAIGRLMYNRTVTYAPLSSPLKAMKDLKGKTVGLPVGAAAERVTLEALRAEGLDPAKDLKIVNLDVREQGPLVIKSSGQAKFDQFDALAAFDPIPAVFEAQNKIKVLHVGKVVSLIMMNEAFLSKEPKVGQEFLDAMKEAYDYYRQNVKQADEWFLAEASLSGADSKTCEIAASVEPNLKAKSMGEIRMTFNDDDLKHLGKTAEFVKLKTGAEVNLDKGIDRGLAVRTAK